MAIWDASFGEYIDLCGKSTYLDGERYEVVEVLPAGKVMDDVSRKVYWKWLVGSRKWVATEVKEVV